MKIKILFLLFILSLTGCSPQERYEFHTGAQGTIWRCDRVNGEVEWAVPGGTWQPICDDWQGRLATIQKYHGTNMVEPMPKMPHP
jgi:hypothetical protein